jgi:hypothetical protein
MQFAIDQLIRQTLSIFDNKLQNYRNPRAQFDNSGLKEKTGENAFMC